MLSKMSGTRYASDLHYQLIQMYKAVQGGWVAPTDVSEQQYQEAKNGNVPAHLRAFIGFGCSWGGKWFDGYARSKSQNYADEGSRRLQGLNLTGVTFLCGPYTMWKPKGMLIYCDPPYQGRTKYNHVHFDHDLFWYTMCAWSRNNSVFVSEVSCPAGVAVEILYDIPYAGGIMSSEKKPNEKLYRVLGKQEW